MSSIITVKNFSKKYDQFVAVDAISFEVRSGSIFAFLGTNGAGKSTTINCLTTILEPTSGSIEINGMLIGKDDTEIKKSIGVVFQTSLLDPTLTVRENLAYRAAFYGNKTASARITELAKLLDITQFLDKPYGPLSGGQKRRADIARALLHKPSILFLDEPTAGLDPKSREQVWQTIYNLQASMGLTVFLTTHYMQETERADDVYVLDRGKKIASGSPQSLRAQFSQNELRLQPKNKSSFVKTLDKDGMVYEQEKDLLVVRTETSMAALSLLKKYEAHISDFEFRHGNMDDVFLALTDQTEGKA